MPETLGGRGKHHDGSVGTFHQGRCFINRWSEYKVFLYFKKPGSDGTSVCERSRR